MLERPERDPKDTSTPPSKVPPINPEAPADEAGTWIDKLAKRSSGLPGDVKTSSSPDSAESKEKSPWAYAGLGIQFAATVGLFAFAGYELDKWKGWHGAATVTLSLIAVIGNLYLLVKDAIQRDTKK